MSNLIKHTLQSLLLVTTAFVSQLQAAELYYFHNDHLGTPQAVTDTSGTVVWEGQYSPFGEVTETVDTVQQDLRFPGQLLDRETGLHYNYFRDYDPNKSRYIESDPIGLNGGMNTYGYAYARPLTVIDPLGQAGFFSSEFSAGYFGGAGIGITSVSCTDDCGENRTFFFFKACGGAISPGAAVVTTGGPIGGMDGAKCRNPRRSYGGYFAELTATAPGLAIGVDIGLTDHNKNLIPDGFSGVNEVGVGAPVGTPYPSTSAFLCHYWYVGEV